MFVQQPDCGENCLSLECHSLYLTMCAQSLLDDIRAQRVPVDFLELFDAAKVPFYDGSAVVEFIFASF